MKTKREIDDFIKNNKGKIVCVKGMGYYDAHAFHKDYPDTEVVPYDKETNAFQYLVRL